MMATPKEIIDFWLRHGPEAWFSASAELDREINEKYADLHIDACKRDLADWEATAEGALALLLLLDQFPRNLYRGSAHSYATDGLARAVARRALKKGLDKQVPDQLRPFFYLPFEHSESMDDQQLCIRLLEEHRDQTGDEESLKWAILHKDIIEQFGRFPHRNEALGRDTTPAEQAYLDSDGFKG